MPTWNMSMLQDPMTLATLFMATTHNTIMEVMFSVALFILMIMIYLFKNKLNNLLMTHNNILEILWTIIPMFMLIYMAAPSLQLLYMLEEMASPAISVKAIGHQWYWTYEYPDFKKMFDSYMLTDPHPNKFRLLDVDNRLILPYGMFIRILCSSTDVIHSWAVPSMGLKMDALPGRINQLTLFPCILGVYFGQCSEICGMNHSFMPIVVEITPTSKFLKWIKMETS